MNLVLSKKNAFVLDMQSWSSAPGSLSSLNILLHSFAMANLHKDIKRVGTYAPHDISALSMQRTAAASGTPKPLGLRALSASANAVAEAATPTCMSRWCPAGVQRTATGAPTRWRCSARVQARCYANPTTPRSWRSLATRVRSCRSHPSHHCQAALFVIGLTHRQHCTFQH